MIIPYFCYLEIFNDGMNAGLQTSQDYLELWQAFLDFLKRKINWNSENLADSIESLREIFQRAINQLFQCNYFECHFIDIKKYFLY